MRALIHRATRLSCFGLALTLVTLTVPLDAAHASSVAAHVENAEAAHVPATPAEPSLALLAERANEPDSGPIVTQGSEPESAPQGGSLFGIIGTVLTAAGFGAVISLKTRNEDGTRRTHVVDTDKDDYGDKLEDFREAVEDEATRPLRAELSAAQKERDEYRDSMVGETVRLLQLSHAAQHGDGDDAPEFDAEKETSFLESLPAEKLSLHFEKARDGAQNVVVEQKTETALKDAADDDGFGKVHTS